MKLYFHSKNPATAWLSNLSLHGFVVDRVKWPSVEHFYQAQKYAGDTSLMDKIRRAESPLKAMKAGQDRSLIVRADWETRKSDVMREALTAKFGQNRRLKQMLLATGDAELVHESGSDAFWGQNREGIGENRLGVLLMELRDALGDKDPRN